MSSAILGAWAHPKSDWTDHPDNFGSFWDIWGFRGYPVRSNPRVRYGWGLDCFSWASRWGSW